MGRPKKILPQVENRCEFKFSIVDGKLLVDLDLTPDFDPYSLGSLLGLIATGGLLQQAALKIQEKIKVYEDASDIALCIEDGMLDTVDKFKSMAKDDDEPIVQPSDAIIHQITMYQGR